MVPVALTPPHIIEIPVTGSKPPIALDSFRGKFPLTFSSDLIVSVLESSEPPMTSRYAYDLKRKEISNTGWY